MIRIPTFELPQSASDYLDSKQDRIDALDLYSEKVELAKSLWSNKRGASFEIIKSTLTDMCVGSKRCNYCEDSAADEVEHIKPKDLYPENTFTWLNYLYACGPCNGPKNNFYAIFDENNDVQELARGKNDLVEPPPEGPYVFINPRIEDPLQFMILDLKTMLFVVHPRAKGVEKSRANYTIEKLRLNSRDYLIQAREEAKDTYLDALRAYVQDKSNGEDEQVLAQKRAKISKKQHPTVWYEMRRQRQNYPNLLALFNEAPELLG